jgi:hypothetical protein
MVMRLFKLFKGYRPLHDVAPEIDGHFHSPSETMSLAETLFPSNELYRDRLEPSLYQKMLTILLVLGWVIAVLMFVAALRTSQSDKDCIAQTTVWCEC